MDEPLGPSHTDGQPIKEYVASRLVLGANPQALASDLAQRGIPLEAAHKLVVHVERIITKTRRSFALRRMGRGAAVCFSALFVSVLWFEGARQYGGPALVFPGLALVGFLDFLVGLANWMGTTRPRLL
jgi:hypothetical protein